MVEATTSYTWAFPGQNKRPPVLLIGFFVKSLQRQGYPVLRLQFDEGGELARSTEVMRYCFEVLHVAVETTGGYNSTNNGKVKTSHCTHKRTARILLIIAGLSCSFWYFAVIYSCLIKNNTLHTRTHFNRASLALPPAKPPVFGCKARIVKDISKLKARDSRTGGDPRAGFKKMHHSCTFTTSSPFI